MREREGEEKEKEGGKDYTVDKLGSDSSFTLFLLFA